mmetsp:Transcript_28629/g.20686  ORF Transcript_28629/g.20686 Transcript_28629/m.20686 type:complete len:167 (+) Transcript_28629:280-780(+)|eukprot:CAMPEP_0116878308 /NCGR_PEP_ID=MMETSP0463-20121206/10041_1 /TAXON_ID=181622 /ORGANISM="Strombidinopsis sp, Strain SopsisLIS2011" /LENGTH=166 /DNA_ID=CAMNT_0004526365 /DNA_START=191 /DNA_END=691 /DNA_ORIENTATION=+
MLVLKIENLNLKTPHGSCIDIKLGTSSVTGRKKLDKDRAAIREQKDALTTSPTLGYRLTGYSIKDEQGKSIEKLVKPKNLKTPDGKVLDQAPEAIVKVLKSNGKAIDEQILQQFVKFLEDLLKYFENVNNREIRGSSLYIVVDNISKTYSIRLIDIASMEQYSEID